MRGRWLIGVAGLFLISGYFGYKYYIDQPVPPVGGEPGSSTNRQASGQETRSLQKTVSAATISQDLTSIPAPVPMDSLAVELNQMYRESTDFENPESLFSLRASLPLRNYETAQEAEETLEKYLDSDPVTRAMLAVMCDSSPKTKRKNLFREALKKKCRYLAGRHDPFWEILSLAREGDERMQLFTAFAFDMAARRQSIRYFIDPMGYMLLRDEVFAYQESLAARGVVAAANTLYLEYLSNAGYLPGNKVLAYYYGKLAIQLGEPAIRDDKMEILARDLSPEVLDWIQQRLDAAN